MSFGLFVVLTLLMSYFVLLQSVYLSKLNDFNHNSAHAAESNHDYQLQTNGNPLTPVKQQKSPKRFLSSSVQLQKTTLSQRFYRLYHRYDDAEVVTNSFIEDNGDVRSVPSTKVKMYFMNLTRSVQRRKRMEQIFGSWGSLEVVPAIESQNATAITEHVNENTLTKFADGGRYGSSRGELALCASALVAIKQSYNRGDKVMLLLEDDMSDLLVDYWQHSIDEVIADADIRIPRWDVIQLHISAPNNRWIFHTWKFNLGRITFVPLPKADVWGGGAQLFSRRGMERFIERFTDKEGKFDCVEQYKKYAHNYGDSRAYKTFRCKSDYVYFNQMGEWNAFAKVPPMFTFDVNEGSTGLRKAIVVDEAVRQQRVLNSTASATDNGVVPPLPVGGNATIPVGGDDSGSDDEERTVHVSSVVESLNKMKSPISQSDNDHFIVHYQSIFDSLQSNIESLLWVPDDQGELPVFVRRMFGIRVFSKDWTDDVLGTDYTV